MAQTVNKKASSAGKGELDKSKLKHIHNANTNSPSKGEQNRGQGTAKAKTTLDANAKLKSIKPADFNTAVRLARGKVTTAARKVSNKISANKTAKPKLKNIKKYK